MEKVKRAVLVYQCGIANVFAVDRNGMRRRLLQADFRACENFAHGLVAAGCTVTTMACNRAGDIIHAEWTYDLDAQPFSDKFRPINSEAGFITDSFLISLTIAAFSIYTVVAIYVRSNFSALEMVGAVVGGAL